MYTKFKFFPKIRFLLPENGKKRTFLVLLSITYVFLFPQHSLAYSSIQDPVMVLSIASSPLIPGAESLEDEISDFAILQNNSLIPANSPETPEQKGASCPVVKPICPAPVIAAPADGKKIVVATAYSSSYDETDSNPFITASGAHVRDGIIAANFLKIGTKVQIPNLYGDKVFVVEDRMAKKNSHKVDIWMPSKAQALQFGVKKAEIVVLEN